MFRSSLLQLAITVLKQLSDQMPENCLSDANVIFHWKEEVLICKLIDMYVYVSNM